MVKKVNSLVAPYFCYLNLTNNCNLRCLHCLGDYSKELSKELNFEEWKLVFNELIKNKVFYVNISGGEPTTHPDFSKIIDYLSKIGLHFILTTNGIFSKKNLKEIIKNKDYLIGVKISLDGYDKETHNYLRRDINGKINNSFFDITLKNIMSLKKENIPLTIATTIHTKNIIDFKKFVKLIRKIDPVSWYLSPIIPSGRGETNKDLRINYKFYKKKFWENIVNICNKNKINVRLIELPFNMREKNSVDYYECGASLNFCEINSDGELAPCTLSRVMIPKKIIKFENIKKTKLKDIWNGASFNKFRKYMTKNCEGCKAFEKCTKCIAQSFKYFGDGKHPTPYCLSNPNINLKNKEKYKKILR